MKSRYTGNLTLLISILIFSIQTIAQNGWIRKADLPTPRAGACASVIDKKIYVIGGATPSFDYTVNEVYDPLTNSWDISKQGMPTPRGFLLTAAVNNIIYAIGGGLQVIKDVNEAYDPSNNSWTTKANMLQPWTGVYGDVVDGKIYTMGGNYVSQSGFVYDPDANNWDTIASIPPGGCAGPLSVTVYNGLIYTFGGTVDYPNTALSAVCRYNPQTNTWEHIGTMPTPRYALRTFLVNGKIYAIGGSQGQNTSLSVVEIYDPVNNTWENGPNLPENLSWFTGAVVDNIIYIFGGTADWMTGGEKVWAYDPSLDVKQDPIPAGFYLFQNYPNPFNMSTVIKYSIGSRQYVTIKVMDILGNEIKILTNEDKIPGSYEITWNAVDLPSGVYFYQLQAGALVETNKMVIIK